MATSDTQFFSSLKNSEKKWQNSLSKDNFDTKPFANVHAVGVRSLTVNNDQERKDQEIQNAKPWRLPQMAQTNSPGPRALNTREKIRRYREYLIRGTKRPEETILPKVFDSYFVPQLVSLCQYADGSIHNAIETTTTRKRSAPDSPHKDFPEQITDNSENQPLPTYSFECSDNIVKRQKIKSGSIGLNCEDQMLNFNIADAIDDILAWGRRAAESPDSSIIPSLSEIDLSQLSFKDIKLFTSDDGKTNVLGTGVYGFVSRGKLLLDEESHDIVAKFDRSSKSRYEDIVDEARILRYLSQTCVVPKFYGIIEDRDISKLPVIVQECFADGEDFYKALDKETLSKKVWIEACLNAAYGLKKIHKKRVLHNDLKPDNILVNKQGEIRFIDMGMATLEEGMFYTVGRALSKCRHLAPEVKRGEETTAFSDIYSFGIVLQEVAKNADITELMDLSKLVLCFVPSDRITLRGLVVRLRELLHNI